MKQSETIGKLAAALKQAQAEMKPATENAKGNYGKFADLGEIIDTIRAVSVPNGLSFSQFPVGDAGGVGVETILMHESGEWLSDAIYLPFASDGGRNSAQVAGGIVTYLRRYSLASIFGVYTDEDTDGQAPRQQPRQTQQPAPKSEAPAPVSSGTPTTSVHASHAQPFVLVGKANETWNELKAYAKAQGYAINPDGTVNDYNLAEGIRKGGFTPVDNKLRTLDAAEAMDALKKRIAEKQGRIAVPA